MAVQSAEPPQIDGPLTVWQSAHHGERASCATCGGAVYFRSRLGSGLFDDQDGWTMTRQICAEGRPDHYAFGAPAPAFTGWGTIWAILTGRLPR
ncbi:hypothetical protein [Pontivivens insulae]|uniref:CENP-V/GFA domain-containing protein n=1 Tax=Pontivivens insulae TaxID=1639689 RepID=A0A2R8AED5_9RHOB|nr:hypothetical protein [Pontivivens insulae]SPF30594.1 hypothetical protein POI8812_02934 [Pontivivens insulae]